MLIKSDIQGPNELKTKFYEIKQM